MGRKKWVIAVDGTAASGKGTIAQGLADFFDFARLDTGMLYRACAWRVQYLAETPQQASQAIAKGAGLPKDCELRAEPISVLASKIAAMDAIRTCLIKTQRHFCHHPPHGKSGAILDGRDIGTVIAPQADVKFFVDAALETRVTRRYLEMQHSKKPPSRDTLHQALLARDQRDQTRATAPLQKPAAAYLLDTTNMDINTAIQTAIHHAQSIIVE